MQKTVALTTHVPTLHQMLLEQQHMIATLKEQLRLAVHRHFGPRNEYVDVDQLGLFGGADDGQYVATTVDSVHLDEAKTLAPSNGKALDERRKAIRILRGLPREIRVIDLPEDQRICGCCGGVLQHVGDESSEQLGYVPACVRIIETRRRKYGCKACRGDIKRAQEETRPPLAKSMASASLIAFLVVSKYADHLPLYRIAQRLQRLGIDISHSLMSDWLLQCAELLEPHYARLCDKVRDSRHLFTDDTILPLQNSDPARHTTQKSRLWVYACHHRRQKPLVAYDFSLSRSQQAPLAFLAGYRGYLQADAFPGYDVLFERAGTVEVACWAHARRKFKEVTLLTKAPGRAHQAILFIKRLYRIERQIRPMATPNARPRDKTSRFQSWASLSNGSMNRPMPCCQRVRWVTPSSTRSKIGKPCADTRKPGIWSQITTLPSVACGPSLWVVKIIFLLGQSAAERRQRFITA